MDGVLLSDDSQFSNNYRTFDDYENETIIERRNNMYADGSAVIDVHLTADGIIENIGFGLYQLFLALLVIVVVVSIGSIFYINLTIDNYLICQLDTQFVIFDIVLFSLGISTGLLIFGFIGDKYGRVVPVRIGSLIAIVATILIISFDSRALIMFLQMLTAFGMGGMVMILPYFAEFLTLKSRPLAMAIMVTFFLKGGSFVSFIWYLLKDHFEMKKCFGFAFILIVLTVPVVFYIKESTRFLIMNENPSPAIEIFKKMCVWNRNTMPSGVLCLNENIQNRMPILALFKISPASLTFTIFFICFLFGYNYFLLVGSLQNVFFNNRTEHYGYFRPLVSNYDHCEHQFTDLYFQWQRLILIYPSLIDQICAVATTRLLGQKVALQIYLFLTIPSVSVLLIYPGIVVGKVLIVVIKTFTDTAFYLLLCHIVESFRTSVRCSSLGLGLLMFSLGYALAIISVEFFGDIFNGYNLWIIIGIYFICFISSCALKEPKEFHLY